MTVKKFNELFENNEILIEKLDKNILCENNSQIENNREILEFLNDNITQSIETNKKPLSADLSDELTERFGKWNLIKQYEYRTKIWILSAFGLEFNVFCSKRGTDIAICDTIENVRNGVNKNEIISFLTELNKLL